MGKQENIGKMLSRHIAEKIFLCRKIMNKPLTVNATDDKQDIHRVP